jgi:GTPase SAR1 family protein
LLICKSYRYFTLYVMKLRSSVAFSLYAKINFKIIVVGDQNTGKTSLILRYVKDVYNLSHNNPQGI